MTSISKLRRKEQARRDTKQDVLLEIPALQGRASDEALKVDSRPGYIYVRIGHDETLAQAYWTGPKRYDMPCIVGYSGTSQLFRVIRLSQDNYTIAGHEPIPEVDEHGATHTWPDPEDTTTDHRGSDPSFITWRQVLELRVGKHTSGTHVVRIDKAPIEVDNTIGWVVAQTINLEPHIPDSGACWVTIYLLPTGEIGLGVGVITTKALLETSDIHVPTFDHFRMAAVMLWDDQTQIRDDAGRADILDLRFPQNLTTGGSAGETPPAPGQIQPVATAIPYHWHVDGPLAALDQVDGVRSIVLGFEVSAFTIYVEDDGTADTTTVDVEKSLDDGVTWESVYLVSGNRPSIAGASGLTIDKGTLSNPMVLPVGTLVRANLAAVAAGARGLDVFSHGSAGEVVDSTVLYAIMGCGRSPYYTGVST